MKEFDHDSQYLILKMLAAEEERYIKKTGSLYAMAARGHLTYKEVLAAVDDPRLSDDERRVVVEGWRMIIERGAKAQQMGRAQLPYFKEFVSTHATDAGRAELISDLAEQAGQRPPDKEPPLPQRNFTLLDYLPPPALLPPIVLKGLSGVEIETVVIPDGESVTAPSEKQLGPATGTTGAPVPKSPVPARRSR